MKKESKLIGKEVIIRSNGAGVLFAKLVGKNGQELQLENVRKFYKWSGANTVEDLAVSGALDVNKNKLTISVDYMEIFGYGQIIPCTKKAIPQIKTIPVWKY